MKEVCEKELCCGCGLCFSQCPREAISMKQDEEGFYYPTIDQNKCVNCGLCVKQCPSTKSFVGDGHIAQGTTLHAYSAYNKDIESLLQSSAGGMGFAIGKSVIEKGGVVFGVKYKNDYRGAEFGIAKTISELRSFNESKYVESDRVFLFKNLKRAIANYCQVLVIGLPCDIAAVRSLVGYPENLCTCKLICRSNTSNKVLNQFVDDCEQRSGSRVKKLSLRYKEAGRPTLPTRYRIDFENGRIRSDDFTKSDYGKAFQILARPSCLNCPSKKSGFVADLTIGDFQGLNPNDPLFKINGVSLVFSHTEKGEGLLKSLSNMCLEEVDKINTWNYNWMIHTPIPKSPFRDEFSKSLIRNGLRSACHELCLEQNRILDVIMKEYGNNEKRVAIWGAGDTTEYLFNRLQMDKWNITKVFDGSKMKHGKPFKGHVIDDIRNIAVFSNAIDALFVMIPSENEDKLDSFLKECGWQGKSIHVGKHKFFQEET